MKICESCDRFVWAKNKCSVHYKKWYRSQHAISEKSREGAKRRTLRWRAINSRSEEHQRYYQGHKNQIAKYRKKWSADNKDKLRARDAKRRALELHACPSWADLNAIKAIYAEARRLSRATGIFYHVDHIYPLVSPYMCGLHVPENLQIIPWNENLKKGNRIQE